MWRDKHSAIKTRAGAQSSEQCVNRWHLRTRVPLQTVREVGKSAQPYVGVERVVACKWYSILLHGGLYTVLPSPGGKLGGDSLKPVITFPSWMIPENVTAPGL